MMTLVIIWPIGFLNYSKLMESVQVVLGVVILFKKNPTINPSAPVKR